MSLYSANRFKNLCPEYVAEAVEQQTLASAKAEADRKEIDKFNVQQTTKPGKEGADDPTPNDSHIVSPTDQQQEGAIGDFIGDAVDKVKNFISGGSNNNNNNSSSSSTSEPKDSSIDFGEKPEVEKISTGDEKLDLKGTFDNSPKAVTPKDDEISIVGTFTSQEAADVSETENVSIVDEAAYIDYLLESLDEN